MPPSVHHMRAKRGDGGERERQRRREQQPEARFRVPKSIRRTASCRPQCREDSQRGERQRQRRRGYRYPSRQIMRRKRGVVNHLPLKKHEGLKGVVGQRSEGVEQRERSIDPHDGISGVQRQRRGDGEGGGGQRRARRVPAPSRAPSRRHVAKQHDDDGGKQRRAHHSDVREQSNRDPRAGERANRILAERAMNGVQRDHEHAQERRVFRVEKRMGVYARVQQEREHGDERQRSAAEHAERERPREQAADEVEGVGQQMARQIYFPRALQPQEAFDDRQRKLERHAVIAVVVGEKRVGVSQNVV